MTTLIASMIIYSEETKYVLTRGGGSRNWEEGKLISDFAVYAGHGSCSEDYLMRLGYKIQASHAVKMFGQQFGLEEKDFRR